MKNMVFAMELKGKVAPVEGTENTLHARLTGRGPQGEAVTFESRVVVSGETFSETGNIDYNGHGKLEFETIGTGHLVSSPIAGYSRVSSTGEFLKEKASTQRLQTTSPPTLPSPSTAT